MNQLEKLKEYLVIAESSPSGLVWMKKPNSRILIGTPAFTAVSGGYYAGSLLGKPYRAHRVVYMLQHGYVPDIIDHIDGNTLNNAVENLRDCSVRENAQNMRGVKGYSYCKREGKYQARIRTNGRLLSLGYYDTPEAAANAYLKGKKQHHPTTPGVYYAHRNGS